MRSQRGVSLIGVIMAAGLLAFVMLAASELFSNMFKGVRATDMKMQSQDVASTLRLALSKSDSCKLLLGLDVAGSSLHVSKADYALAVAGKEVVLPLHTILLQDKSKTSAPSKEIYWTDLKTDDGTGNKHATILGDLEISSSEPSESVKRNGIQISFGSPIVTGGHEHIGTLAVALKVYRGRQMGGISLYTARVPMRLKYELDASDGKYHLVECNSETPNIDPRVVCIELGGQWLDGEDMPKSRCSVGGDLMLAVDELPDNIKDSGGINDDGQRVEICFYQNAKGTKVQQWSCPAVWGTRSGWRCAFNHATHQWAQAKYNSSGTVTKWGQVCNKGVKVSMVVPEYDHLELNEALWHSFGDSAPADLEASGFSYTDQDRLVAVSRCQTLPNQEKYSDCANTEASSLEGQKNSCLYVHGIKLANGASNVAVYNAENATTVDPNNFTGWIQAGQARAIQGNVNPAPLHNQIAEANGQPCFRVEVRTENAVDPGLSVVDNSAGAALPYLPDPSKVKHCVLQETAKESVTAPVVPASPAKRKTMKVCGNGSLSAGGLDSLTGGQCWYFQGVTISGFNPENPYTGWVWVNSMTAASGARGFTVDAVSGALVPKDPTKDVVSSGIPCNVGVRALPAP